MKPKSIPKILIGLSAALTVTLLIAGLVLAAGEQINWQVFSSGSRVSGSDLNLQSTSGQPVAGQVGSASGQLNLCSGFVCGPNGGPQAPTAVLVSEFRTLPSAGGVIVIWKTTLEVDLLGFRIYRSIDPQGAKQLMTDDLIPAKGIGQIAGADYSFLDNQIVPGQVYFYWLESVETDTSQWLGPEMFNLVFNVFCPLMHH
jgi:hypothetical protein